MTNKEDKEHEFLCKSCGHRSEDTIVVKEGTGHLNSEYAAHPKEVTVEINRKDTYKCIECQAEEVKIVEKVESCWSR